jgi:DNA-directed RNA polymerase subunit RPC12/RpoP
MSVRPPSQATLTRYGLTSETWLAIVERQGNCCPICDRDLAELRTCIDHEHVKGWKELPAEDRLDYVRGVVCAHCNHRRLGRWVDLKIARAVVRYLLAFQDRREQRESRRLE